MLITNAAGADPTKTSVLRKRFQAQMGKRFRKIKGDIRTSIVVNDALGLRKTTEPSFSIFTPASPGQFDFPRTDQKIEAFLEWLRDLQDQELLEIIRQPGAIGTGIAEPWTNTYVKPAYQKGIQAGRTSLRNVGIDVPEIDIDRVFNQPVHVDRAGALYTRVFSELKGVTAAMDSEISRILSEGLLIGGSPEQLAKQINGKINSIGLNRARTIARTEIVRAHHLANIQEFRNAGVNEVTVMAEWSTALDDRVCPECAALEGKIFTLDEIEGMIPLHPNCVTGETLVNAVGIKAVSKRHYEGEIIIISTASGKVLNCTPNHPILTPLGWLPAQYIEKVGHVIIDQENDIEGTAIEKIAECFSSAPGMSFRDVHVCPSYFHGDGAGSETAVILATEDAINRPQTGSSLKNHITSSVLADKIMGGRYGRIKRDSVIDIQSKEYSGMVYNLETEDSYYSAHGIITHNCRCVAKPALPSKAVSSVFNAYLRALAGRKRACGHYH